MTDREAFDFRELKLRMFAECGYVCQYPGCTKSPVYLAHNIAKSKPNLKKYGKEIIYHPLNMRPVCEIPSHNDFFNIGNNPEAIKEKLKEIGRINDGRI